MKNKVYFGKSERISDLSRQVRNQQAEIDLIRLKLEKAEKSGFTTKTKSEILELSMNSQCFF